MAKHLNSKLLISVLIAALLTLLAIALLGTTNTNDEISDPSAFGPTSEPVSNGPTSPPPTY